MDRYDVVPRSIRFWTLLFVLIPSIFCSLFILYHFLFNRALRSALNNHIFIVIIVIGLFSEVTYYPWRLYQLQLDGIWIRSPAFCTISEFINQNFYCIQTFLFAWATVERHILIFNDRLLKKKLLLFLLHYLPIIVLLVYCFIFYSYTFFFPPCENPYFDSYGACMRPCLWYGLEFSLYELYGNSIFPLAMIVVFSLLLLFRVIRMKMRMQQPNHLRRNIKMAIQLLGTVMVYLVFVLPYIITLIIPYVSETTDRVIFFLSVFEYIYFFGILFTPFVCILTSNELRSRWMDLLRWRTHQLNTVVPLSLNTNRQQTATNT